MVAYLFYCVFVNEKELLPSLRDLLTRTYIENTEEFVNSAGFELKIAMNTNTTSSGLSTQT